MIRKAWWLPIVLGLSGCAITSTGFDHAMLQERLHEQATQVTDDEIRQIQALQPQLNFPCRIAVALKGEHEWRWTAKDIVRIKDYKRDHFRECQGRRRKKVGMNT